MIKGFVLLLFIFKMISYEKFVLFLYGVYFGYYYFVILY